MTSKRPPKNNDKKKQNMNIYKQAHCSWCCFLLVPLWLVLRRAFTAPMIWSRRRSVPTGDRPTKASRREVRGRD